DGIRDFHVTGVQTCALPISRLAARRHAQCLDGAAELDLAARAFAGDRGADPDAAGLGRRDSAPAARSGACLTDRSNTAAGTAERSEERRVGEEGSWERDGRP